MKYKPSFVFILKSRLKRLDFLYEYFFKNKKTLDVGCGWGKFLKNDKQNITGIDSNRESIDFLLKNGFNVKLSNVNDLPFDENTFDAIHCRNVIEHLNVDEAYGMIKECTRVLKNGGLFVLCSEVVNKDFWGTFGHIKPYPPGSIKKLLRDHNQEEFESIKNLEFINVFYIGNYFKIKIVYLISALLGYVLPSLFAREYFMILKKSNNTNNINV